MARRVLVSLLLTVAIFAVAAQALGAMPDRMAPRQLRAEVECGTVMAEGFPFEVHVAKGNVPCPRAQEVAKKNLGQRRCGREKLPACVADGFHCRGATFELQRKTGIALFCYTLKNPLPPSKDHSPYRLSLFTRAITVFVGPEE